MKRKFRISIDGRAYEVIVEELPHDASIPSPSAVQPAASALAAAAPAPVHARPNAGAGDEVAPLAGTVESIDVTVGQSVAVGDKIATIEAMKMKTEVFARGTGKVAAIAAKPGDPVDAGAVLLTLA
jgi:biotin carboxyl carrier protein